MEITLGNVKYTVIKNEKDAFNLEELESKFTDYFQGFDYVLGDYAYGKLRLKGFNDKENKNFKPMNDIATLDDYLTNYCAFGCRHFVISKVKSLK